MKTYTAEEARRLILQGSLKGEYAVPGSLDLSGCDLRGVPLPVKVGGSIYLSGCDLTGVTLPVKVSNSLDLSGCDLRGAPLPVKVDGWLALRGCDLTNTTLPAEVVGSLILRGCDLTGATLPAEVGGSLILTSCINPDPSQWWRQQGQSMKRHCLAISDYALIETEDRLYSAGCRGPWTAGQALAHWGPRSDERAKLFVKAIKANEKRKH